MTTERHPAVNRLLNRFADAELFETLAHRLSGADLTALLLEVYRTRAAAVPPSAVLAQYTTDRFTRPSNLGLADLLEAELLVLRAVEPDFETVATSPLAPLGAHSVVAGVSQNRVVTTSRNTEVAADPTNSLALEAALRRKALLSADPRSTRTVNLATIDRVVRAQTFEGPLSFAHFSLLGLVSAGRDTGNRSFEHAALTTHIRALTRICQTFGAKRIHIGVTNFSGSAEEFVTNVAAALARSSGAVNVASAPERAAGRGYYPSVCFKLFAEFDGEYVEVGDGGLVDWTQRLLGSQKERLFISGLGIERLTLLRRR